MTLPLTSDCSASFATIDPDHEIGSGQISRYETEIAPEVETTSTYGDCSLATADSNGTTTTEPPHPTRSGAGRFGFLAMPEPVVYADLNVDRAPTRQEFAQSATAALPR